MQNKMFSNKKYYIALFTYKNHAIQLFYTLEKKGVNNYQLISTPCKIKAGCSYSIKFNDLSDIQLLKEEAKRYNKIIKEIYLIERVDGKKIYEKLDVI